MFPVLTKKEIDTIKGDLDELQKHGENLYDAIDEITTLMDEANCTFNKAYTRFKEELKANKEP